MDPYNIIIPESIHVQLSIEELQDQISLIKVIHEEIFLSL